MLARRGPTEDDWVAGLVARFDLAPVVVEKCFNFLLRYFAGCDDVSEVSFWVVFVIPIDHIDEHRRRLFSMLLMTMVAVAT